MKYLLHILLIALILPSALAHDDATYDPQEDFSRIEEEIGFWSDRLAQSPETAVYQLQLGHALTSDYQLRGEISSLRSAEKLYQKAADQKGIEQTSALLSLAQCLITQHRFCEAYDAVLIAESTGEDKRKVALVKHDIESELGMDASASLATIAQKNDIQYLIRRAKKADADGELPEAIGLLQSAREYALDANNRQMIIWTSTNLAEFYGHNGNIQSSKKLLHEVLRLDPANWYATKLLAWIAYSHDDDRYLALQYIDQILDQRTTPELLLLKAEITEDERFVTDFLAQTSDPSYGVMYHSHLAELKSSPESAEKTIAVHLAETDYLERPTPETAALWALTLHRHGQTDRAQEIMLSEVYQQTYEPVALRYMLEVCYDDQDMRRELSQELKDTRFEMGPVEYAMIREMSI